ncbi:MAG: efflux transporter outer membrane subunit [Gemmobacter sp.]|nr:efflux transporter outer membrane subunit [Gemmobacter sp.]
MLSRLTQRAGGPALRVVAASMLLTACAAGAQNYQPTRLADVPARWSAFSETAPRLVDNGWVASFRSSVLTQLVQDAMAHNRDLRVTAARLAEAQAMARFAGAGGFPSVSATLGGSRTGNGSATSNVDVGLAVNWELDLWGRVRGEAMAAGYEAVAASAIHEAARQSLAAAVAETWIEVNGHARARDIARQEVGVRQALLRGVEDRVAAQAVLAVDANWARAELDRARERQIAAEGDLSNALRVLEVLTGRYPAGRLNAVTGLPQLPGRVPLGLPSQILERRPDIIAAERRVASAFHRLGEAQAARLPRISLSGAMTRSGGSLGAALDPGRLVWTLAGNIIAPLIDGGQRLEAVNIRTAQQAEALALYGAAALTAFREVETAISNEAILRQRLGHLNSAAAQLESAVRSERDRYEAGEAELFRLEEMRVRYYAALRDANAVRVALLRNRVRLHLALGGSFAAPAPAAVVVAPVAAASVTQTVVVASADN